MTPEEAIAMARTWTKDMEGEVNLHDVSFFHAMKALLDHTERQRKDIEELTLACQTLLRGNRRLQDELPRSKRSR
jgi:hypothetical protein